MTFLLLIAVGFLVGRRLGTGRAGFVTLATVALGSTVAQIAHLATTTDRSQMTMLPIVAGACLIVGLLLGAWGRPRPPLPGAA
jgi:hypothetical protein